MNILIFAEILVEPLAERLDLAHGSVGEHPVSLAQINPSVMTVGRDVRLEAALEVGVLGEGLRIDQEAIERPTADRVIEDRSHLAHRAPCSVGNLSGAFGGAGQLSEQDRLGL